MYMCTFASKTYILHDVNNVCLGGIRSNPAIKICHNINTNGACWFKLNFTDFKIRQYFQALGVHIGVTINQKYIPYFYIP